MAISPYLKKLRERIGHELLVLPPVCAIVVNNRGEVLLQHSKDTNGWTTIGGMAEPGEEPADAVVREVMEEAGIRVEPLKITSVTNSAVVTYPNGDRTQYVVTTFLCRPVPADAKPYVNDDESWAVRYFAANGLPELRADQLQRVRLALVAGERAFFTPPGGKATIG